MVKIRGLSGFPKEPATAEDWACILGGGTTNKDEVDISFTPDGEARAYSRSCTLEDQSQATLPNGVNAKAQPCVILMQRTKATLSYASDWSLKIEEWTFPDSTKVIEVSSSEHFDTAEEVNLFAERVYRPLLEAGITPLAEGKTKLLPDANDSVASHEAALLDGHVLERLLRAWLPRSVAHFLGVEVERYSPHEFSRLKRMYADLRWSIMH